MVEITRFKTGGISSSVPEPRLSTGGDGAVGNALANIGGTVQQLGTEYLQQKRTVEAQNYKTTRLQQIHLKEAESMKSWVSAGNLRDDGTMNPSVWERRDDASFKTLADVRADFWDNEIALAMDEAPTSDASNLFEVEAVKTRNTAVLEGETRSQAMYAASGNKYYKDRIQFLQTHMLTLPKPPGDYRAFLEKNIMEQYSLVSNDIVHGAKVGRISDRTSLDLLQELKATSAKVMVENFRKNGQYDEVIKFIAAGVNRRGTSDEEDLALKLFDEQVDNNPYLDDTAKEELKSSQRSPENDAIGNRVFEEISSGGLSPEQTVSYLNEAYKQILDKELVDISILREDMGNLLNDMRNGVADANSESAKWTLEAINNTKKMSPSNKVNILGKYAAYMGLPAARKNIFTTPPANRRETLKNYENAEAGRKADLATMFPNHAEQINKSKTIQKAFEDAKSQIQKFSALANKAAQEDSVGYFTNRELFPYGAGLLHAATDMQNGLNPASRAISRKEYFRYLDQKFQDFGIQFQNRKYVKDEDIQAFAGLFQATNRTQDKVTALMAEKTKWGDDWPKVSSEYIKRGKLPNEIKIASLMSDNNAMVSFLDTYSPASRADIDTNFKGRTDVTLVELQASVRDNTKVNDFFEAMNASYQFQGEGREMEAMFRQAITYRAKMEFGGANAEDTNASKAVETAVNSILADTFRVAKGGESSKVYIPSNINIRAEHVEAFLNSSDEPKELARFNIRAPRNFTEGSKRVATALKDKAPDVKQLWLDYVSKNGRWVNNPNGGNDGGLYLVIRNQEGVLVPARNVDGEPVSKSWEEIRADKEGLQETRSTLGGN